MSLVPSLPTSESDSEGGLEPLTSEEAKVLTSDPASFLIASAVNLGLRDSVSELKQLICHAKPELSVVFDKVLAALAKMKMVRIFGDRIVPLKKSHDVSLDQIDNQSFFPKLTSILAQRILRLTRGAEGPTAEHIRAHYLPDNPVILKRMYEIQKQYCMQMDELVQWYEANPQLNSDKVRMTVLLSGTLNPEDF